MKRDTLDRAIVCCFLDDKEIQLTPKKTHRLAVDLRLIEQPAQSTSENSTIIKDELDVMCMPKFMVPDRYHNIYFTPCQ